MKSVLLLLFSVGILMTGSAQSYFSLSLIVQDKETRKPIHGAMIVIKQTGWTGKQTNVEGKAFFEKSVPVGSITYLVTKDGYLGYQGEMNITTIEKDNTKLIELSKAPTANEDKLLVRGTILDKQGANFEDVSMEATVGDIQLQVQTDRDGNYRFIIPLSKNSFPENSIVVKANYRGQCRQSETISIPRTSIIVKDFKLDCSPIGYQGYQTSVNNPSSTITNPTAPFILKKETAGGVEIAVTKCEIVNNKVICYLTYQNVGSSQNVEFAFQADYSKMIDENGNTYTSITQSISNMTAEEKYRYVYYILPKGVIARGKIEFAVSDTKFNKIASLQIKNGNYITHSFTDLVVTK